MLRRGFEGASKGLRREMGLFAAFPPTYALPDSDPHSRIKLAGAYDGRRQAGQLRLITGRGLSMAFSGAIRPAGESEHSPCKSLIPPLQGEPPLEIVRLKTDTARNKHDLP